MGLIPNLSLDASQTTSESLADNQSGGVGPGAISFGNPPAGNSPFPQTPGESNPDIQILGYSFPWWELVIAGLVLYILSKK